MAGLPDFAGLRDVVRDAVREALGLDALGVTEIRRLVFRPGDRLVLKLDHRPNDAEAESLIRDLKDALGDLGLKKVLILEPGMDLEVLSAEPPAPGGM